MNIEPPPSVVELVNQNPQADSIWKRWLRNLYDVVYRNNYNFIVPTSLNVVAGGTPTGSITDVQTLLDGNVYQLPEVGATPGFDLEFDFTDVGTIAGFVTMTRYTGISNHIVSHRLYNYTDTQDDTFLLIPHTATNYQYRTVLIPSDAKYIDGSNNAQMIFVHESAGTGGGSHNFYVDYVALLGKPA